MLCGIDEMVSNLESIVYIPIQLPTNNNKIRILEITRKKQKKAVNVDRERQTQELAWYRLFPNRNNSFGDVRKVQMFNFCYGRTGYFRGIFYSFVFENRILYFDKF